MCFILIITFIGCAPEPLKVTIFKQDMTLDEMTTIVNIQTGKSFVYEQSVAWTLEPLDISVANEPLDKFLTDCCDKWGVQWRYAGNRNEAIMVKREFKEQ